MFASLEELRTYVRPNIPNKRLFHVLGVEQEADTLARRWGVDPYAARQAAIVHDMTKFYPLAVQLHICEKYDIIPSYLEKGSGDLLHGITAAALAWHELSLSHEVADAVRFHTTGRPRMTMLDKVVYMADYIEPTRDFDGVGLLRVLAYADIHRAVLQGFAFSIAHQLAKRRPVHPLTVDAWNAHLERG